MFNWSAGGVTMFENGKLKCKMNMVEAVHGLIVEENDIYTIRNLDLSVHNFNKGNLHSNSLHDANFDCSPS